MFGLPELFWLFLGKPPIEIFSKERLSAKDGIFSLASVFGLFAVLAIIGAVIFQIGISFVNGISLIDSILPLVISVIAIVIVTPIIFVAKLLGMVVFGGIIFLVVKYLYRPNESFFSFIGGFLRLYSSVLLILGILMLIPVLGWFGILIAELYSLVLLYRFVSYKFALSSYQAIVVVAVPIILLMVISLIFAVLVSGLLFLVL